MTATNHAHENGEGDQGIIMVGDLEVRSMFELLCSAHHLDPTMLKVLCSSSPSELGIVFEVVVDVDLGRGYHITVPEVRNFSGYKVPDSAEAAVQILTCSSSTTPSWQPANLSSPPVCVKVRLAGHNFGRISLLLLTLHLYVSSS